MKFIFSTVVLVATIFLAAVMFDASAISKASMSDTEFGAIGGAPELVTEVGDDEKLPLKAQGFSRKNNIASLDNVTYSISDPALGSYVADPAGPPNYDGFFVPTGPLGSVVITATGTNRKNEVVSGTLDVTIVAGAAVTVTIQALAPVPGD